MLRSLALLGLLGLACCAAPAAEEEVAGSKDAVTLGASWRSPISEGYYDDGHSSLFASNSASRQAIWFETRAADGTLLHCDGLLDIPLTGQSPEMTVKDDNRGCDLQLTMGEDHAIHARGTIHYQTLHVSVATALAPRKDNAFVGSYTESFGGAKLTITASSNASTTLKLVAKSGDVIAASQTAAAEDGYDWYNLNVDAECPLMASFGFSAAGQRTVFVMRAYGAKLAQCPPDLPMLLTE